MFDALIVCLDPAAALAGLKPDHQFSRGVKIFTPRRCFSGELPPDRHHARLPLPTRGRGSDESSGFRLRATHMPFLQDHRAHIWKP
jgi:hypothetical protein